MDDTKAEITDDGQTGRLRVAAIPTIAPYFLPEVLQTFGKTHPKATVIVQEDTTENLIRALTDGAVDVAILALPLETQYLEIEELFEEELLLLMSVDHPLTAKKQIRLSDIESLPFVLLGEAHCLSDAIISFCRQKSFHPVSVERTSQLAMVQELVSLNHGISMVPAMAQKLDTCSRRVYRSLSGTRPSRKIAMVSNPLSISEPAAEELHGRSPDLKAKVADGATCCLTEADTRSDRADDWVAPARTLFVRE